MERVYALQDSDGHWYVFPEAMRELFMIFFLAEDKEAEFENIFGKYRTGGDLNLVQLHAEL